jgi:hypothetical protein
MDEERLLPVRNTGAVKRAAPVAAAPFRKLRLDLDSIMNKLVYICPAGAIFFFSPAGSYSV